MPTDEEKARAPRSAGGNRGRQRQPDKSGQSLNGQHRYTPRQQTLVANWGGVDADVIRNCLAIVADNGGALRLGYTRDGGAYAIGVYGDGDPYTVWVRPNEDLVGVLTDIAAAFSNSTA